MSLDKFLFGKPSQEQHFKSFKLTGDIDCETAKLCKMKDSFIGTDATNKNYVDLIEKQLKFDSNIEQLKTFMDAESK